MRFGSGAWRCFLAAALLLSPALAPAAPAPGPSRLVWHAEARGGEVLESSGADEPINPASVVKVATTLRALERLGPYHRFVTRFAIRGTLDRTTGTLDGDLIVLGGGDPDFHTENAFLVAEGLNGAGLRRVRGRLLVSDTYWIGWEGGSARRHKDPRRRAEAMAWRMREALDPKRWSKTTQRTWSLFSARHEIPRPSSVTVLGGIGIHDGSLADEVVLEHQSNPLVQILRRLNTYSNNDIERLEASIGPPGDLTAALVERWGLPAEEVRLETLSGLASNRMTPRLVVRLLRDLESSCERLGVRLEAVLPVAGCGPSTLNHYPGLRRSAAARALVAKTGTLTQTDGGVAVLAGKLDTAGGEVLFCTAAPQAGASGIYAAREHEVRWVVDLLARAGGPRTHACPPPLPLSYDGAIVATPGRAAASRAAAGTPAP